jgi:hypothetical protein
VETAALFYKVEETGNGVGNFTHECRSSRKSTAIAESAYLTKYGKK